MRVFTVLLLMAMVATLAWAEYERRFPRPGPAMSKRSAEPDVDTGRRVPHINPNHYSKRAAPSPGHEPSEQFKREVMEPGNERQGKHLFGLWGPRWGWGWPYYYPPYYPYPFWG